MRLIVNEAVKVKNPDNKLWVNDIISELSEDYDDEADEDEEVSEDDEENDD